MLSLFTNLISKEEIAKPIIPKESVELSDREKFCQEIYLVNPNIFKSLRKSPDGSCLVFNDNPYSTRREGVLKVTVVGSWLSGRKTYTLRYYDYSGLTYTEITTEELKYFRPKASSVK